MRPIEGVLFEPVGCLAEFPAEPFHEITQRLFGGKRKASKSASRTYWHLLNLIEAAEEPLDVFRKEMMESLELQAVDQASVYDDVAPALTELRAMGAKLVIASSLSQAAVARFLERSLPHSLFSGCWNRDNAGGVKSRPLECAVRGAALSPDRTLFLTDTAEGIRTARGLGLQPILMMNEPDEAKRLAMHDPAGGIVSFYELPDFARLLTARNL